MQQPAAPAAPAQREFAPSIRGTMQETLIKIMIIYFVCNFVFVRGPASLPAVPPQAGESVSSAPKTTAVSGIYQCSFGPLEPMSLRLWLSTGASDPPTDANVLWSIQDDAEFRYSSSTTERKINLCLTKDAANRPADGSHRCTSPDAKWINFPDIDELTARNGSLYVHARLETAAGAYSELHSLVTRAMPPPPPPGLKTLLESSSEERAEAAEARKEHLKKQWVQHWRDNATLAFVADMPPFDMVKTPLQITSMLYRNDSTHQFAPAFYLNDFWVYSDHFWPLNETVTALPLEISVGPMGMWKWQLFSQMEQSFKTQMEWGMASEMDEMKRVLSDTNPWFLGLTVAVSMVHMVFDFLAFKNDISFWKSRKSLEGLSVRSILISFGCQLIIFLYLADSETSWMILLSAGVSVVIEGWKITKTNDVTLSKQFPFVHLADKNSYKSQTKEFDEQAMGYLAYVVYPLVVIYAVYSLVYDTHKSYYSWFIGSLSGAVYMFGFLQMTPQLFINYKLKSVAHLPWRVFVYKALNTFIDDMFAFIIKMPTMHRLSAFRDDIIFFIFLYQRWIYRVDKTRVNEFGQVFEDEEEEKKQKAITAAAAAADKRPKIEKVD